MVPTQTIICVCVCVCMCSIFISAMVVLTSEIIPLHFKFCLQMFLLATTDAISVVAISEPCEYVTCVCKHQWMLSACSDKHDHQSREVGCQAHTDWAWNRRSRWQSCAGLSTTRRNSNREGKHYRIKFNPALGKSYRKTLGWPPLLPIWEYGQNGYAAGQWT